MKRGDTSHLQGTKQCKKTIDETLEIVGPFNTYQWLLLLMLSYCIMTLGLQASVMRFIATDPGWQCTGNETVCKTTTVVTSSMDNYKDRCNMQSSDWKYPEGASSIVTEFNLVCDRSSLKTIAIYMIILGWFLGAIIFGFLSDRYGRKISILSSMVLMSMCGVISSFVGIFWLFTLLQLLVGAGVGGALISVFILNTEFVGPEKRTFAGIVIFNFWTVGECFLPLFAYVITDWKYINLASSAPGLLLILLYCFIPESIRWLLVNNRHDEAENILKKVADVNGFAFPLEITLKQVSRADKKGGNIFEIFRDRYLTKYTVIAMFAWFATSMISFGVSLSTVRLGGNLHLVFLLTSVVSIPANFVSIFVNGRFGRKKSLIVSISATVIALVAAASIPTGPQTNTIFRVTLVTIGNFLITISFNTLILLTFELLPTPIRNVGMGILTAIGRFGAFTAFSVMYLSTFNGILPFVVIGIIGLISAGVSLLLPETKGLPTKETLQDNVKDMYICNEAFEHEDEQGV